MIYAGVVGATGLVGRAMIDVLQERSFPVDRFFAFASGKSTGRTVKFKDQDYTVEIITPELIRKGMILFGATSADIARSWIPPCAGAGAVIVDNSSAFRMKDDIPLIVPEVNGEIITGLENIIANPNCSTIQLVTALAPLLQLSDIDWICVTTYQAASGAGKSLLSELKRQQEGYPPSGKYSILHENIITSIGRLDSSGFCNEEIKLMRETGKIMGKRFPVYSSTARVPVRTGHTEAVVVKFRGSVSAEAAEAVLAGSPGVSVCRSGCSPLDVEGTDEVFVNRIRNHPDDTTILQFWVLADNLRKGAALNAVQIAEKVLARRLELAPNTI